MMKFVKFKILVYFKPSSAGTESLEYGYMSTEYSKIGTRAVQYWSTSPNTVLE